MHGPLRGPVHALSTAETLQFAQVYPRRASVLCAGRRILQMWMKVCALYGGERGIFPRTPTSNTLRTGSLVMQELPEELNHTPRQDPSGPSPLPLAACPRRRLDVTARLLDGETVVLDRQAGLIHQLNHTASYIWARCDGQSTIAAIAHQLAHAFAVEPTVAARDVRALVRQLQALQLLESGEGDVWCDRNTQAVESSSWAGNAPRDDTKPPLGLRSV
jgi:hypothetical protein